MKIPKLFFLVPIVIFSFSYLFISAYKDVKERTLSEFNNQQFAFAKQASRGIESFFINYQRELLFLSKLISVSNLNDHGKNLLKEFYNNYSDQIEAITLIDSKGVLQYTYPYNVSAIGQDISSQAHVKAILNTHNPIVSDVFTSVQGFQAIAYHIPVMDGTEYKGSIAILIPLDKLSKRFIENIKTGKTGYSWMISEEGIELYNPVTGLSEKPVRDTYNESPTVLNLIDRASSEKEGTAICYISTLSGNKKNLSKILASFYRISLDNTFWTIIIFTPEKEVFATFTSFRNRLLILFSLVVIVIFTYFYLALKASSILKEEKKRKEVEDILWESEKRFRIMFELSPVGIILINENGTIIEVNTSFCETLGYLREELISNNIRFFASPDKDGDIERNIAEIFTGKTLKHEVTNIKKDGTTCFISLYETKIILPNGNPGILSVSNDITEKKKAHLELISAKEKAEESDRLKSTFLTNMSHELRTPLNAIIGFSSFMIETAKDEEIITYSKIIVESGNHLLRLVEDILDISMIEIGQLKINYGKVDIILILNEVKNIIQGEILRENKASVDLRLNTDFKVNNKYVQTDSRKVKQVLINLLKNALKFTEEGYIEFGFVEEGEAGNRFIRFFVKDTGIGIDSKYHDIIFNIFRQVDETHIRKYGGTGIGLSIAKKIVEMLGGKIWIESEPGKGSLFSFTIPLIAEKVQKETIPPNIFGFSEKKFNGKTILIAEDEISNYEFLRIFFTKMKIRVLWAKNGLEAINFCDADPSIDLVIMDIKIPILDGYQATEKIKAKRPELPVIALTAYAMMSDREDALKAGCDNYLSKPIQIDLLNDLLSHYL